jgi:hypothetical protein
LEGSMLESTMLEGSMLEGSLVFSVRPSGRSTCR